MHIANHITGSSSIDHIDIYRRHLPPHVGGTCLPLYDLRI